MPSARPSSAFPIALPFLSTSLDWSSIAPWATRTAGRRLTLSNTSAENAGASVEPSFVLMASFELMTASVDLYESL